MGFNYAIEKAKFEREWTQLRVEYEKAGMSTEKINILHDYDWENFKKERIYATRPNSTQRCYKVPSLPCW